MATVLISIISIQLPLISKCSHLLGLFSHSVYLQPSYLFYAWLSVIWVDSCARELACARFCASTFSIEIDIQIIAYSLASTPSRLMCLDRHTSSNFIVVNVKCVVVVVFFCFFSPLAHCSLDVHIHLTGHFEKQEAVSMLPNLYIFFCAIFVISHPLPSPPPSPPIHRRARKNC